MNPSRSRLQRLASWLVALDTDARAASRSYRLARRIAVLGIGFTLLLVGVAMIVLPGPATVVMPMGLAVLGLEFAWARRWLAQVREHGSRALESLLGRRRGSAPGQEPPAGGTTGPAPRSPSLPRGNVTVIHPESGTGPAPAPRSPSGSS